MRERLKAIRTAASALAEPAREEKRKALPGLVASLRSARAQEPLSRPAPDAGRTEKIAVIAITRHGIALAGRVVAALPGARLFAPEKFAETAERAAPGAALPYAGKTGEALAGLFADSDAIIAIVSLGAMIRLMAPYLKSNAASAQRRSYVPTGGQTGTTIVRLRSAIPPNTGFALRGWVSPAVAGQMTILALPGSCILSAVVHPQGGTVAPIG